MSPIIGILGILRNPCDLLFFPLRNNLLCTTTCFLKIHEIQLFDAGRGIEILNVTAMRLHEVDASSTLSISFVPFTEDDLLFFLALSNTKICNVL